LIVATQRSLVLDSDEVTPLRSNESRDRKRKSAFCSNQQEATRVAGIAIGTPLPTGIPRRKNARRRIIDDYWLRETSGKLVDAGTSGRPSKQLSGDTRARNKSEPRRKPQVNIPISDGLGPSTQSFPRAQGIARWVWDLRYEPRIRGIEFPNFRNRS